VPPGEFPRQTALVQERVTAAWEMSFVITLDQDAKIAPREDAPEVVGVQFDRLRGGARSSA